jgi:hypothetical protein
VVRDLLAGRIVIAIDRDGLDAQALQRNQHFLAQFAGAEQHDFGGVRRQGGSEGGHWAVDRKKCVAERRAGERNLPHFIIAAIDHGERSGLSKVSCVEASGCIAQ